jgi:hypothetical protein
MKINFVTRNKDDNSGSYRIWVRDLCNTLVESGHDAKISLASEDIDKGSDVIILCKSAYNLSTKIKQTFPNCILGAINIPCNYYDKNIDFVIVGSIEEYTSMSLYENVFIHPLIEKKYENIKSFKHSNKDTFNICFHGHYPHLFKFEPFLRESIEYFDKNIKKVKLKIITGDKNFDWKDGRPNVDIEMFGYDDSFVDIVQSCDIGIVPNVLDLRVLIADLEKTVSSNHGLYDTDYFIRMKNKTNPGRSYVFYQLGLPVIHDLSPSSFELMSKSGYNICAHDTRSYLREMKRLLNKDYRNEVSQKNKKVFEEYYSRKDHANKMIQFIKRIKNG